MFIAAFFTIAKIWKEIVSVNGWIDKENVVVYIYKGILLSHEKEGNPAIHNNMDLEGIMLKEVSHTEKDKYYMMSLICGI